MTDYVKFFSVVSKSTIFTLFKNNNDTQDPQFPVHKKHKLFSLNNLF